MPVESATYISDLVITNPVHTDGLAQADSHLRMIKSVVKATFPNITGPVTSTQDTLNNAGIPLGGIILWSGTLATIPANWTLCDGTLSTPDLRDRFIIGAGSTYIPSNTGGATAYTSATASDGGHAHGGATGLAGAHNHAATSTATSTASSVATSPATSLSTSIAITQSTVTGTVWDHTLTLGEIPAHDHGLAGLSVIANWTPQTWTFAGGSDVPAAAFAASSQGGGGPHSHNWNGNVISDTSVSTSTSTTVNTLVNTTVATSVSTSNAATTDHQHTIDTSGSTHSHALTTSAVPPYYALAYIMRIA